MPMTVEPFVFYRTLMDGEFGTASILRVTRLIDATTGEQVGHDEYHRHVLQPGDDDANEDDSVKRARAGFIDQAMRDRYDATRTAVVEVR